jgi:hypothetical protein
MMRLIDWKERSRTSLGVGDAIGDQRGSIAA